MWAKNYDEDSKWNPAMNMDKDLIIPMLDPKSKDVILEIGCGTGRFTLEIAKKCRKIIGVDFAEKMIEVARKKSKNQKNIEYRMADIQLGMPYFKSQSFDKVVCPLVINHIPDISSFFEEIFRLLKKRGILVFDDVNPDSRSEIRPEYRDLLYEMSQKGKRIFYIHSLDDLVHNLHRTGFEIEQAKFIRIDERISGTLSKHSFERNTGRTFGVIMRARKD
jgi:ubiquinone/menaquinone biosynthesis C-methylase UbiE